MAELKPCPFCGKIPMLERFIDRFQRDKYDIECRCPYCEVQPMTPWYEEKNDAIEAWNRRAE